MRSRLTPFSGGALLGAIVEEAVVAPLLGLVLYGSRGRGDHSAASDVDLCGIASGGPASTLVLDRVSICRYPLSQLLDRARGGDLFVLHLVCEGRSVYERRPVLDEVRAAFTYRPDYRREVQLASDVGWFLVRHGDQLADPARVNEKVAWCVRTILVARTAELRRPVFSARAMADFARSTAVGDLIANRSNPALDLGVLESLRRFLDEFGATVPAPSPTLAEQRRAFGADRNVVGVSVVRSVIERMPGGAPLLAEVVHVPR